MSLRTIKIKTMRLNEGGHGYRMPCRDKWEGTKPMSHFRSPETGSWGWDKPDWHCCHHAGLSVRVTQGNVTDSVSVHLPEPFLAPTTTTTPLPPPSPTYNQHLIIFFSNSHWTFVLQKAFIIIFSSSYFFKQKKKKSFPRKIYQNTKLLFFFVKLEMHGLVFFSSFFPGSCF